MVSAEWWGGMIDVFDRWKPKENFQKSQWFRPFLPKILPLHPGSSRVILLPQLSADFPYTSTRVSKMDEMLAHSEDSATPAIVGTSKDRRHKPTDRHFGKPSVYGPVV